MTQGAHAKGRPARARRLRVSPSTREGSRALWLVAGGLALVPLAVLLVRVLHAPSTVGVLGAVGVLAVAVGGAFAMIAVARGGERSIAVIAALLAGLYAALFAIGEAASVFVDALHH